MELNIIEYDSSFRGDILDIINYFVENSFAAYPDSQLDIKWVERYETMTAQYPSYLVIDGDKAVGFASLHSYHRYPVFSHTAEITYFILPEYTGLGLGKKLLSRLLDDANRMGITEILASISSKNEQSLKFHEKQGFRKVGEFENIGKKQGELFSIIYMQKSL